MVSEGDPIGGSCPEGGSEELPSELEGRGLWLLTTWAGGGGESAFQTTWPHPPLLQGKRTSSSLCFPHLAQRHHLS